VIGEAMEIAYRGTTQEIQSKIRRVLSVWRERSVFDTSVLADVDQRLEGNSIFMFIDE
jgi:regulator of Ty1 transposition protein 103